MAKYGFLGLGIMGCPMAANLLKAGHELVVWNRTPDKCAPLVAQGAARAGTPAEVVAVCPVTFAMVSDPEASLELLFGTGGVLESIGEGKAYVDCSTVDPHTSIEVSPSITEQGGRFLEAPVSGSRKPAEDGTLLFLCAGDQSLLEEIRPALDAMGKTIHFLGEVGQGARMKLVINMIMGGMITAFAEGLVLADKAGIAADDLFAVLDGGVLANPLFRVKGPRMAAGDFAPAFPLKHEKKDLRLALQLGEELTLSLPTATAANAAFLRAMNAGCGDEDFSAVLKAIRG
ncbi:MAG: NAD(P)-dependent oxidoreductase [Planctomycetaceae bacterium]|nr:NAD(P)-dependent oxidoreductase [Planctomycetaceae bacterium]